MAATNSLSITAALSMAVQHSIFGYFCWLLPCDSMLSDRCDVTGGTPPRLLSVNRVARRAEKIFARSCFPRADQVR